MNFTEYIRHIVQLRGYSFAYGDAREINRVLTTMDFSQSKNGIVAFAHLITEDEYDDHARATIAVYFCHLCPFDFDANETGEWQGYLRNAASTMFSDISAGNIARTSNMRYTYGYDDYAENVLWVCARFTIEALQCGCNEFVFRDEIVKNIEYVRTLENGDYEYKLTFTDGSTQMFASPRGPNGEDGEPGPPGTTDYNELRNKPSKLSEFSNDEGFITDAALDGYAKTEDIPTKTSELTNDSGFVTPAYHDATKQDTITDLATIRSGAAAGATAVQPSEISDMETRTHAANAYVAKESGKGLSSNDYTTAEKSKLAGIESGAQKNPTAVSQLENDAQYLKLQEVKPNGNIVLTDGTNSKEYMAATPSGDPMHYAYVAAGAEYNATGVDVYIDYDWSSGKIPGGEIETIIHLNGKWFLNGIGDLTTDEIRAIYIHSYRPYVLTSYILDSLYYGGRGYKDRTNWLVNSVFSDTNSIYYTLKRTFQNNNSIKVASLPNNVYSIISDTSYYPFYNSKIEHIIGIVHANSTSSTYTSTYSNLNVLRSVYIHSCKTSLSFEKSSFLFLSVLQYLVDNAANTTAITITLHANAYARCVADTTEYTYLGQTYTGVIAYAAARLISIVSA